MHKCIVLNGDYSFLNVISWKKAIKLLVKGKAIVLKYTDIVVNTAEHIVMKIPAIMKLIKIIRTIYRTKVPFSKKNVMIRDRFTCQYCGSTEKGLTIDHIVPVSRGGKSTFENCVTACKKCNTLKGNKLPSEAHMYLKKQPVPPTINQFLQIRLESLGLNELLKDILEY